MSEMELTFFNDPGHGWLRAPKEMLKEYGISDRITDYSYEDSQYVYLEEDCDASILLNAIEATGIKVKLIDKYSGGPSFIRRLGGITK